jgi:glutamate synthase (NADPH/NADH) small chain
MDPARAAIRMGAGRVIINYRRGRAEMPAHDWEIDGAVEEGVELMLMSTPKRFIGEDGKLVAVECISMELGEPDESGRRRPVPIVGAIEIIPVDAVVCAIGNSPNPLIAQTTPGLEIGKKGNIVADEETGQTSREKIWAAGDVVTGAATVILAMGAGRKAARSMHEYLMSH